MINDGVERLKPNQVMILLAWGLGPIEADVPRCVVFIARRKSQGYCHSNIRGNQMNLGGPSDARFADGL